MNDVIDDCTGYTFTFQNNETAVNIKKHDLSKPYLSIYVLSSYMASTFGVSPATLLTVDTLEWQQRVYS